MINDGEPAQAPVPNATALRRTSGRVAAVGALTTGLLFAGIASAEAADAPPLSLSVEGAVGGVLAPVTSAGAWVGYQADNVLCNLRGVTCSNWNVR